MRSVLLLASVPAVTLMAANVLVRDSVSVLPPPWFKDPPIMSLAMLMARPALAALFKLPKFTAAPVAAYDCENVPNVQGSGAIGPAVTFTEVDPVASNIAGRPAATGGPGVVPTL